jgi:glycosyltransferase involved in cell wall biosynthesis
VPVHAPTALRDAIQRLLTDRALAATLAQRARQTVEEHYSLDRMASAHASVIEAAIAARRTR